MSSSLEGMRSSIQSRLAEVREARSVLARMQAYVMYSHARQMSTWGRGVRLAYHAVPKTEDAARTREFYEEMKSKFTLE